jgi:hypothetical protein
MPMIRGEAIRDHVGEFLGQTFIQPVLAKMSESPFKSDYFDGGGAERAFRGQLNQQLSEKIGRSMADGFAKHLSRAIAGRVAERDGQDVG